MNKTTKRFFSIVFVGALLISIGTPFAFAKSGGGTGGGTGGGGGNGTGSNSDIALTIVSSSIKSGDTNVLLNPTIDLQFNKNVVNIAVKSNNSKCFHLVDGNEKPVSIKIIFPDDQLRQDYREHIFITPEQGLSPNSKYTLYIDKTLQAKNTKPMEDAKIIVFTTGEDITSAVNSSLKDLGDNVEVITNKLSLAPGTQLNGSAVSSAASKAPFSFLTSNNIAALIIGGILIVVVIYIIILLAFKRKREGDHSDQP